MKKPATVSSLTPREYFAVLVNHTDDLFAGRITSEIHGQRQAAAWGVIAREGLTAEVCALWREWQRAGAPTICAGPCTRSA